ncbi:granulocyte-macrophage colony-stimulating factor isoform X1 [Mus musculus]|uniref:granulocyte-macrophage colony-stimulating factor isoform X1 n=1 Tax=Mus musculus TaxID=10090 RepID=UPI0003D775DC|nr:granulocyte-macrophage colony-stimulating factor isoform X1 [Mus musculus]|eukprot:XP_006532190.1 PREDICTED: granulocyte-macrophage colony-stimulating factor isoform X1 [Mus musculus]
MSWPCCLQVLSVPRDHGEKKLTCVQTRLKIFEQGLRGNFTKLKGALNMTASYYQTYCPPTPETDCETQVTTYADFIDSLKTFLTDIPFECKKPGQK